MRRRVLYIPGLGDDYDAGRRLALRLWRIYGVRAELIPMRWAHEATYEAKYNRVLAAIKAAETRGEEVVLIGESAGGSMALNVFADRPSVEKVITICGVNSPHISIAPRLKHRNPAFAESVSRLAVAIPKIDVTKLSILYALYDESVAPQYTRIPAATLKRVPGVGHLLTIALLLTICAVIPTSIVKAP